MVLKRCFILVITLLCFLPLKSQSFYEFEISLYFEDNAGRKDTITFGFNDNATLGIDTVYQEVDIYGTPIDSLDVRIVQRDTNSYECIGDSNSPFPYNQLNFTINRDLKTDIRSTWAFYQALTYYQVEDYSFEIILNAYDYPLIVTSSSNNFYGYPIIPIVNVIYPNCIDEYNYNTSNYYTNKLDNLLPNVLDSLIITDTAITSFIISFDQHVGINEFSKTTPTWKIQPNPAQSNITLSGLSTFDGKIEVLNLLGEVVTTKMINSIGDATFSIQQLTNGVYFIRYFDNETKTFSINKWIKN